MIIQINKKGGDNYKVNELKKNIFFFFFSVGPDMTNFLISEFLNDPGRDWPS
jgi:hypothetical protein